MRRDVDAYFGVGLHVRSNMFALLTLAADYLYYMKNYIDDDCGFKWLSLSVG